MKGFIIYETPLWGNEENTVYLQEVKDAYYTLKTQYIGSDITCYLEGTPTKNPITKATCNKSDTYDFETGALIALMKMCGFDKSYKAIEEAFKYNSYDTKKTKELEEENIKLKKRINELEIYNNQLEDRVAGEQRGGYKLLKDMEKLQHEYDLCKNSENALKCSVDYLNKTIAKLNTAIDGYKEDLNKVTKRCEELEIKESILNKQEETINKREEKISVYFGGRGCGKQYKALVALFKKLDQKKVDEAYKEAYNTKLPLWQKEVLNQMYGVYQESKEKIELPRTLDINGTVYRKSIQIKDFSNDQLDSLIEGSRAFTRKFDNEWYYKIPTKRDEMWAEIFALHKESDVIIKVKKEDINTFLHELENKIPEITWYSCVKIFETRYTIGDIYEELKTCDAIYFRLHKRNKLSYTSDSHIYPYRELKRIDYLPPMRWDLFKKGRIAVKVTYKNYKEFYDTCERELGKKPSIYSMLWDDVTISICKKDGNFEIFNMEHQKKTGRKILDWEDVR